MYQKDFKCPIVKITITSIEFTDLNKDAKKGSIDTNMHVFLQMNILYYLFMYLFSDINV